MFISREEIRDRTGYDITQTTLALAQVMVETFVGREEAEVEDASDVALLGKAVMFQAIYIRQNPDIALEQAAIKSLSQNEATTSFDTAMFAPFMSPWAFRVCNKVSWRGTRSVRVGTSSDYPGRHAAAREWFYE